ncbi:heme biosynthesis HemY N-terminal domain-containing protein [Ponticaulis sp.]|uniref:heme biosynthesis protein HemY n=1 Tax=Ponticaulis sp. TaxID=2020902 RepID=UPI00260ED22C|nr:heme biosynthesis HemY N-terminal domain-containing protein [Ponticaulis sp.]MDF1679230.1 tetratricopeptide repeat protein [Ponticaulis sp.]
MTKLFWLLLTVLLVGALVVLAMWANDIPWRVVLERENQPDVVLTLTGAAIALLVFGAVIAIFWAFITGVFRLPTRIKSMRLRSRKRKGNEALANGLLAIEGGDIKGAKRLIGKALSDAEDERLALLLDAMTAEQEADWTRAERAYAELSRKPGAHLAGLRGLTGAAVKRGDYGMAIERAREALEMKGETGDWPFRSLFEIYVARGNWEEARTVLAQGETKRHITSDNARRRRGVLLTAEASDIMSTDPEGAERILSEALKTDPAFPPAAYHLARLQLARDAIKPAITSLETGWKAHPHPALALVAERLDDGEGKSGGRRATNALIAANKTHRETALLKADTAIAQGEWEAAEKALAPLLQGGAPTSRVCRLMEMISSAKHDEGAARTWSERAASAAREPEWSDIDTDGTAFMYSKDDWARMVYAYGDSGQLIHPRHETYRAELDVARTRAITYSAPAQAPAPEPKVTPTPGDAPGTSSAPPPVDYIKKP